MKATELMIGDWVSLRNKPYKIGGFSSQSVILKGYKPSGLLIDCSSYIAPIPLTAEILEKNGWRKFGLPYEWQKRIWVQRWHHSDIDILFDILETPKYDGFTWKGVEINEVHIFQHALRLCGLHELADNFKI